MKREQYMKAVLRKLSCTRKKKKEIERELRADIQNAVEEGEDWEQIEQRMGTPKEAAEEFNENFSPQEIKKAKRTRLLLVLAVVFCILACLAAVVFWALPKGKAADEGVDSHDEVFSKVQKIISLVEKEDYDTLREQYADEVMKDLIQEEQLNAAKRAIASDWGSRVSLGNFYMSDVEQMGESHTVTQLNVSYEHTSVTYTISFNEEGKLNGLYMK